MRVFSRLRDGNAAGGRRKGGKGRFRVCGMSPPLMLLVVALAGMTGMSFIVWRTTTSSTSSHPGAGVAGEGSAPQGTGREGMRGGFASNLRANAMPAQTITFENALQDTAKTAVSPLVEWQRLREVDPAAADAMERRSRRVRMARGRKLPGDFSTISEKPDWPDCSRLHAPPAGASATRKYYVYDTARPPVFRMTVDELDARGWERVDKRRMCEAELLFTNGQRRFGWKKLGRYQIPNHLFMERYIADKSTLADHLAAVREEGILTPFWPETYWMRDKVDRELLRVILLQNRNPDPPFLVKDPTMHRGTGVRFLEAKDVPARIARLKLDPDEDTQGHDIVQRYIPNPLLLPPHGRKFDMRVYWFVASVDPVRVYYHDGTTRSSLESFDPEDMDNMAQHLTNVAVQKKNKAAYAEQKDELRLSFDALGTILKEAFPGHPDPMEDVRAQMRHAIATVFLAAQEELKQLRYTDRAFSLIGGDFIIDADLRVWLLEIQEGPVRSTKTDATQAMWLDMTNEQFDILFEIEEYLKVGGPSAVPRDLRSCRNFQLIVDDQGEVMRPVDNLPVVSTILKGRGA